MLTGRRAFAGETAPDTMTAILNEDPPDLRTAAPQVPPALARIVERCLEKNPAARFQSARDLAFALEGLSGLSARRPPPPPWHRAHAGLARLECRRAAVRGARARCATGTSANRSRRREAVRFEIAAAKVQFGGPGNFAVSPDGRRLAFVGGDRRRLAAVGESDGFTGAREPPGTEVGDPSPPPFWSPDSRFVAFYAGGKLKKLDVSGGLPQPLCDLPTLLVGGSWNRNGDIIVGNIAGGILTCPRQAEPHHP